MSSRIAIIEQCGRCEHSLYSQSEQWVCIHSGAWKPLPVDDGAPVSIKSLGPPPGWCPLPKAADVAAVKPLVWIDTHNYAEQKAVAVNAAVLCTVSKMARGWAWYVDFGQNRGGWEPCESLEAGKAVCEAHYREVLFGPLGPLVRLDDGITAPGADNRKASA